MSEQKLKLEEKKRKKRGLPVFSFCSPLIYAEEKKKLKLEELYLWDVYDMWSATNYWAVVIQLTDRGPIMALQLVCLALYGFSGPA